MLVCFPPLQKPGTPAKPRGILCVLEARVEKQFTLIDYIRGGCEISLFVAIDVSTVLGRECCSPYLALPPFNLLISACIAARAVHVIQR